MSKRSFHEEDKMYMPGQEKLPVVAYTAIKTIVKFIVKQHLRIKELEKELRDAKGELKHWRKGYSSMKRRVI